MGGMKDTLGDDLFCVTPPSPKENGNEHHLERVSNRIAPAIFDFCSSHVGQEFHMENLVKHIREKLGIAPDSPSRILRSLRQDGVIDYVVVNRKQSLYRIESVKRG